MTKRALAVFAAALIFAGLSSCLSNGGAPDKSDSFFYTAGLNNFDEIVIEEKKPVIVLFWTKWSPPCREQEKTLRRLKSLKDRVKFVKVNIDENIGLLYEYYIRGIPTTILFFNGEEEMRFYYSQKLETMEKAFKKELNKLKDD